MQEAGVKSSEKEGIREGGSHFRDRLRPHGAAVPVGEVVLLHLSSDLPLALLPEALYVGSDFVKGPAPPLTIVDLR